MEFFVIASLLGLCVRIGRAHDRRDRLTSLLLERIKAEGEDGLRVYVGTVHGPLMLAFLGYREGLALPPEAYPLAQQLDCLRRCEEKKWVEACVSPDDDRPAPIWFSFRITTEGRDHLRHLRALLPQEIPAVRLLSR